VFVKREFLSAGGMIAHGQVVVAVQALEGAAARDFDGHFEGRPFTLSRSKHGFDSR